MVIEKNKQQKRQSYENKKQSPQRQVKWQQNGNQNQKLEQKQVQEQKQLYSVKAKVMKALAHPLRLEIVDLLLGTELCVEHIAKKTLSEHSNVSRHLSVLVSAGLLQRRKEGLNVYYRLKMSCISGFFRCVNNVLDGQFEESQKLLGKK